MGHRYRVVTPRALQVVQLGRDARQRPAEEVPVADLPVRVRPPLGGVVPVPVDPPPADHPPGVRRRQAAEAIWKYLVSHTGTEPRRRMVLPVDGQLPGVRLPVGAVAGFVQHAAGAVLPPEAEAVPDQLRRRRRCQDAGKAHPVAGGALQGQLQLPDLAGELVKEHRAQWVNPSEARGRQRKVTVCPQTTAPKGSLQASQRGSKTKGFTHGMRLSPYGSS